MKQERWQELVDDYLGGFVPETELEHQVQKDILECLALIGYQHGWQYKTILRKTGFFPELPKDFIR